MKKNYKLKKRKNNPKQRHGAVAFTLIIVLVFICLGGYMAFVVYPKKTLDLKRIADIPWLTIEQFKAVSLNGESLIEGTLSGNKIVGENNLAAYVIERWEVEFDDDEEEYEGRWIRISENWPNLTVVIPRGKVGTTTGVPSRLRGRLHEYIAFKNQGPAAEYGEELLSHGSERIRGVKNQDLVTIVGEKIAGNIIRPEYFYFGSRYDFLKLLSLNARVIQVIGLAMIFFGIMIGTVKYFKK